MANISRHRTAEYLRVIFEQLQDHPDGLPAKVVLGAVPMSSSLSDYDSWYYSSHKNSPRFEKIIHFSTIVLVHAGWLGKNKGRWFLTDAGRQAYYQFTDPEIFYQEAIRLYHEWKRSRPLLEDSITDEDVVQKVSRAIEESEEKAWEQINQFLINMKPDDFQAIVADLFCSMGYQISLIAPSGIIPVLDLIAYPDPTGTSLPLIKVHIDLSERPISLDDLQKLISVLAEDDAGWFISSGGFTLDAKDAVRTQERGKITLLDLDNFYDMWIEHYDSLSQASRLRFPLKPVYFLTTAE